MAQKQTKKTTAAKGRKKAAPKKAQQKPIRREVGAGVCLLLAVFTVLACFQIHAAFLDALATLCRDRRGFLHFTVRVSDGLPDPAAA